MYEEAPTAADTELKMLPDLAGKEVVDSVGFHVGSVYASVVDAQSGLLRYLDVTLDRSNRHVLVPIGHARLQPEASAPIRLRAATLQELEAVPPHRAGEPIPDELQDDILLAHGRSFYGERYYAHPCFEHTSLFAGDAPIRIGAHSPEATGPLAPLTSLEDYSIAEDEPDIRGWPLHAMTGPELGSVCELLVDPRLGKVLYVVVQLDGEPHQSALPIGFLAIHDEQGRVRTPALTADDLRALPAFPVGNFSRESEDALRAALDERLSGPRRFSRCDFTR